MSRPVPRFQIVQRTRAQRVPLALVLGAVWLLSLVLVWHWASVHAVPELVEAGARLRARSRRCSKRAAGHANSTSAKPP
ncbi:MAG TPA: hypothetical protein VK439_04145 [Rubrivivax sp.]|nr:hypothetical protein [Rubrivivax sp.]